MRIMLVEDDAATGAAMALELADAGHEVTGVVATVQSAMALARVQRPDLALVDIELGRGGSGIAAARGMRRHLGVPSLFVTADPDRARAAGDAALGLVAKPYRGGVLLSAVAAAEALMRAGISGEPPAGVEFFGSAGEGGGEGVRPSPCRSLPPPGGGDQPGAS
jgi:two-component system, response regulator PdtaR